MFRGQLQRATALRTGPKLAILVNGMLAIGAISPGVGFATEAPSSASPTIRMPSLFGDHMVITRDRPIVLFGDADGGGSLFIQLGPHEGTLQVEGAGPWKTELPPLAAGGPYELVVKGANELRFADVMIGEVWLCSGQSNMEWPLRGASFADEVVPNADDDGLRLFHVPRKVSAEPQLDVAADWTLCTPESAAPFSAVAYYFGKVLRDELKVAIGLIHSSWGGTRIEPWTPAKGASHEADRGDAAVNQGTPAALYNGMIRPLVPYSIRGAIWYQGESNLGDGMAYRDKMESMIDGWRDAFASDLAFYFVQLAPYEYGGDPDNLPLLRDAQTASLDIANTGMVVTTDIGNLRDIHPRNKRDVGARLARLALAKTYGRDDVICSGPLLRAVSVDDGKIIIEFDHADGLTTRNGVAPDWFVVVDRDGESRNVAAAIEGEQIVINGVSDEIEEVRFGWSESAEPNLVNGAGLPAVPFRSPVPSVERE